MLMAVRNMGAVTIKMGVDMGQDQKALPRTMKAEIHDTAIHLALRDTDLHT